MKAKRLLSIFLALVMVMGLAPVMSQTAQAAGSGKAIQLGSSGISGYDSTNGYDYIYYGAWDGSPIKWRVLDTKTNTGDKGLFLLSDALLGTGTNGNVRFQQSYHYDNGSRKYHKGGAPDNDDHSNCRLVNAYQGSDAQGWCSGFYNRNLTEQEQKAILATVKSDDAFKSSKYSVWFAVSANILDEDKVFFLSAEEAEKAAYGFPNDNARIAVYGNSAGAWWLRSPDAYQTSGSAGVVDNFGVVIGIFVNNDRAARPAFNLNLESVLFTSAAVGGKIPATSGGGNGGENDAIFEISDTNTTEWKLTLLDADRQFAVTEDAASGAPGGTVKLNYTGATVYNATTAPNEYISAILTDENRNLLRYGKLTQPTAASGEVEVKIPSDLVEGTYTLKLFSEQYNGGENDDTKLTDYASAFDEVELTVRKQSVTVTDKADARVSITGGNVTKTYGDADFKLNATAASEGANGGWTWRSSKETVATVDNDGNVTIHAAGNANITAAYESSTTIGEATIALTVEKANPVITDVSVTSPTPLYDTAAIGDIVLGFTSDPSGGTLTLDGGQTLTVGTNDYNWTYTPADTANYNTATGTVSITVEPAPTYEITFDPNGGKVTPASDTTGTDGKLTTLPTPTRTNYTFDGWYTEETGGTRVDENYAFSGNTTIYARWTYTGGGGGGVSTYAITLEKPENGRLTASRTTAASGTKITVTTTPDEGFETDTVKVTDRSGREIAVTKNDDGTYSFTMPSGKVTATATFKEKAHDCPSAHLKDVDENAWYHEYIDYVVEKGLMQGVTDDLFAPNVTTSRAMIVTILYRLEGRPAVSGASPFDDVASGQWYTDAIIWANSKGIVEGYGGGKFGTDDNITREQFATILYRYAKFKGYDVSVGQDTNILSYDDAFEVSDWAMEAMQWAVGSDLITGRTETTLVPKGDATRAEAAAILMRFIENVK